MKISNLRASGTVFTDRARWHFMAFYGILSKNKQTHFRTHKRTQDKK